MPEFAAATVRLRAPEDSVALPVRTSVELGAWAAEAARRLAGPDDEPKLLDALAAELHEAAADTRTRAPITALSYVPEPRLGELARIELSALTADDTHPTMTVDLLHRYLTTPSPLSYRPPASELRPLPTGPAIRVRHAHVQDPDRGGTGTVLETCAYGIVPDANWGLVLVTSWRALAYTDALCELTDRLALTVEVT
ncbi:hypothetical protein [Streptomyces pseudovenezuelae]|uniref:Uncharacterized protein n=1 Tax=Streptomyces pseudovenezuelae TaxID=67350 RepID=A0ABT6LN66_9ACTN|nr:hypothetical protein [Streptomyces pseudovenezuelae]MDH6217745.1 hypothetical protein [Streptomyces pseudovenezuelae]